MSVQQHNEEEVVGDPMIWSASIPPRLREQARVSYAIPVQFLASLYPSEHAGVYEALNFQTPSISTTPCTVTPEGFFSRDPPTPITLATLTRLRTLRIPPKIVVNQLQNLSRQAWLNGNLSIVYAHISTSTVTHFPLWVIAYWKGVIDQHAARQNWVAATGWLATELRGKKGEARRATARDVRVLLESTPWQVQQQGMEETEPLHQAARRLLGPCYTSDGDLNNLLHLLNLEVSRDVHLMRRVRVESTHFTTRLIEAYNNRDDYKSNKKYQWLHDVGNDIFTHHQRLVSVAHLNGLTDSQDDVEEHWAAVVLDAEHLTLRFGDSLGQRMPTKMEAAYLWYVDQHSDAVFDVHTLPITKQADSHSCGPLAYNACAHEVFPGREGLCLPRDAIMLRLQLFAMICKRTLEMMPIGDEGPGPIAELQHFPFTFESPLVPALPSAEGASLGPDDQMACALPDAGAPQPGALAGGAMRDGDKSATWGGDGSATWGSDEMDYGSISSVSMHSHCDDDALTLEAPTDVHSAPSTSYLGPVLDTSTDHSNEGCADSEPNPPKLKKSRLATSLKAVVSGAFVQMKATITTKPAQERKHATLRGFFPVEDKEQHAERLAREFEELRETREERDRLEREQAAEATAAKRANDRLRQQRSRAKRRALAAQADGDGDGGTAAGKKRKRTLVERDVSPEDLNIAEASRPARKIRKVDNDKNKKNTGRPRKKEHKEAKRTNWHVPLLWAAIDDAAQRSRIGPWRASQIYRRTQQNILLRDLKEQVIGRWIERGTRSWKAAVLAKVEDQRNRGNLPGGQSTRSGILEPYPDLRQKIKDHLEGLRNAGVGLTLVGIRAIMIV